jgi:hypothetical protein
MHSLSGLKPHRFRGGYGTVELVPFPNPPKNQSFFASMGVFPQGLKPCLIKQIQMEVRPSSLYGFLRLRCFTN